MIIKWFKALKEATLKKQKEQEFIIRKNGCLNNMLHELETEQAIALFNEVSEMFNETIKHRLQKAEKEIEVIGKFQNKQL